MSDLMKYSTVVALTLAAATGPQSALAERTIRCESHHDRYQECSVDTHGYVRLSRQLSETRCQQGRNWDYDRSNIWVDDGCRAEFVVEDREHSGSHSDHNSGKVVAAAAGLAIIGALVAASNDKDDKHNDDNYHGSRHSSYVPNWMSGDFVGYNVSHDAEISMYISSEGRVEASVNGQDISGYVNDERMYIGDVEFYIDHAGNGFNTVEVGNESNQVHYHRR